MNEDERHKEIMEALRKLTIAVGSLNPDPEQTIGQHRRAKKRALLLLWYAAIVSTFAMLALVGNFIVSNL